MENPKIFPPLIRGVQEVLASVFATFSPADKILEKTFKHNRQWGARDRKWVAETSYDLIRWWRLVWNVMGREPSTHSNDIKIMIEFYLEKFPALKAKGFSHLTRAQRESIPDWMDDLGSRELGDRWDAVLKSLNEKAPQDLRVNQTKADLLKVKENLEAEGVPTDVISGVGAGLTLRERKNVFVTQSFLRGEFEMQDRASQRVGYFLEVEPGMRVIDACAGAGGKTLHLADLMKNKGKIVALDIHEWKLDELKKRARRGGFSIIEGKVIENNKVIKRLEESADRLLLDVPCTGIGVLRRNPDRKWKVSLEELLRLQTLQSEILKEYARIVKVGGKMVYSTCSVLPSENEDQVKEFLAGHPQWQLEEMLRLDPDQGKGDGFFMARLKRI